MVMLFRLGYEHTDISKTHGYVITASGQTGTLCSDIIQIVVYYNSNWMTRSSNHNWKQIVVNPADKIVNFFLTNC